MRVLLIAINTFRKASRKRVFLLLLIMALGIISTSHIFGFLSVRQETRVIKDISLASISLFGMLIGMLIAAGEISGEIETRIAHTLLAKPISRAHYLAGKFLGVVLLVAFTVIIMGGALLAVLTIKHFQLTSELAKEFQPPPLGPEIILVLKGIYVSFLELFLLTSVATALSAISTATITVTVTIFLYIVGHLTDYVQYIINRIPSAFWQKILMAFYLALPNLENFNVRNEVITGGKIPFDYILKVTGYGLAYTAFFLVLAFLVFRRRELL